MARLAGKVAVVTGASKGIGSGIAKALAAAGARVAVNYSSDRNGAERVAQEITHGGSSSTTICRPDRSMAITGLVRNPPRA
jgi:3-oxoacyl-[acyl-carrier protein] reductase